MSKSLKVILFLMIASVSLLCVTGNKGGGVNINCDKPPVNQKAHHGSSVTINCKYPREEESNTKHFCREDENLDCTNLISAHTADYTKLGRFSLRDDKQRGVYTVTISTLTEDDAGIYWCVMERADGPTACLTKIHLSILNWDDITPKAINHATGEAANIKCTYPDSDESNEKFLCKGENPFKCEELINTTDQDRDAVRGRFHIRDNRRTKYFYVDINNLSIDDSGSYWCGSSRAWQGDEYTKILLTVAERRIKREEEISRYKDGNEDKPEHESDRPDAGNTPNPGMVAAVVVGLALLLILVAVLVLCRHNLRRTQVCCTAQGSKERTNAELNTEGNHEDPQYEEIQLQNEQASSRDPLPSVYATVNPPADQLHYASVNFPNDVLTDGNALPDTNKNGFSACDYSCISRSEGATHPPAAEQVVYSTVSQPES